MEIPNQSQPMSQNAAQWLAEVQSLQRQIKELQQERDKAYASADNWRKLYEGEGQQRRRDAAASAQKIEQLRATLSAHTPDAPGQNSSQHSFSQETQQTPSSAAMQASVSDSRSGASIEKLQQQMATLTEQCQQLAEQLEAEQTSHERTRQSLTAALGDAVDQLARERQPAPPDSPATYPGS